MHETKGPPRSPAAARDMARERHRDCARACRAGGRGRERDARQPGPGHRRRVRLRDWPGRNELALGAPGESDGAGAAYVIDCATLPCGTPLRIAPAELVAGDAFGTALGVSGDTLVATASGRGARRRLCFRRRGGGWSQQAKLGPSGFSSGERFGLSVSLSGDRVVVGAGRVGVNGAGAVYVFVRNGTAWTEEAKLTASDGAAFDAFGTSVSLDADTLLVGAPMKASTTPGSYANGAVYVLHARRRRLDRAGKAHRVGLERRSVRLFGRRRRRSRRDRCAVRDTCARAGLCFRAQWRRVVAAGDPRRNRRRGRRRARLVRRARRRQHFRRRAVRWPDQWRGLRRRATCSTRRRSAKPAARRSRRRCRRAGRAGRSSRAACAGHRARRDISPAPGARRRGVLVRSDDHDLSRRASMRRARALRRRMRRSDRRADGRPSHDAAALPA